MDAASTGRRVYARRRSGVQLSGATTLVGNGWIPGEEGAHGLHVAGRDGGMNAVAGDLRMTQEQPGGVDASRGTIGLVGVPLRVPGAVMYRIADFSRNRRTRSA